MALDYSTLSDAELEAIANDDYSKLSDATLAAISNDNPPPPEPGMMQKAGQAVMDYGVKPVAGVVGTGLGLAAEGYSAIPGHDIITGVAAYKAAPHLANKAGAAWEGTKQGYGVMKDLISGANKGPIAPGTPANPAAVYAGQGAAPAPAPQQPGMLQRGMDYANKMRQIAAEKVMQNAGTIGKAGIGAAAALTPGNIGQKYNFPTSGPMRGMEINPQTGRPWTQQELSALGQ